MSSVPDTRRRIRLFRDQSAVGVPLPDTPRGPRSSKVHLTSEVAFSVPPVVTAEADVPVEVSAEFAQDAGALVHDVLGTVRRSVEDGHDAKPQWRIIIDAVTR